MQGQGSWGQQGQGWWPKEGLAGLLLSQLLPLHLAWNGIPAGEQSWDGWEQPHCSAEGLLKEEEAGREALLQPSLPCWVHPAALEG